MIWDILINAAACFAAWILIFILIMWRGGMGVGAGIAIFINSIVWIVVFAVQFMQVIIGE